MKTTTEPRRLRTAILWSIAALAVAGTAIVLIVQHFRPVNGIATPLALGNIPVKNTPAKEGNENRTEAGGGSQDESLASLVAQLQQAPDDQELREKIVKLAAQAGSAPEIPEEARDHHARARKLFEAAETINDVGKAVDEYQAALLAAPWWPEANQDLGLALAAAQRPDEAIAALRLFLASQPGGSEAAAMEEEIHKIEAARNKRFSMPLEIATRCQFKLPALVRDYWLFIDGRLVSAPPHAGIDHEFTLIQLGPEQGCQFWDKEGMAAVVRRDGKIIHVRKGADIYTSQTFDVQPGDHTLSFLLLSQEGFPFAIASAQLELKMGQSRGFWFNMPANYVGSAAPRAIMPFVIFPDADWQAAFSQRQAIVKRRMQGFADDPVAQALSQAGVSARVAASEHSADHAAVWVNLPAENGGKRELDARLLAGLVKYLADKHGMDERDMTSAPDGSPADFKDSLAKLVPLIRAHNERIEALRQSP
jgi:tetratricopeptide (TPR) repeat protein